MILDVLAVATGGAVGAGLRYALHTWGPGRRDRPRGTWDAPARATFAANALGCGAFGLWAAAAPGSTFLPPEFGFALDLFVLTGLCGGLTTFSTAVADGVRLASQRGRSSAFGYAAGSLVVGILALWLGLAIGR